MAHPSHTTHTVDPLGLTVRAGGAPDGTAVSRPAARAQARRYAADRARKARQLAAVERVIKAGSDAVARGQRDLAAALWDVAAHLHALATRPERSED